MKGKLIKNYSLESLSTDAEIDNVENVPNSLSKCSLRDFEIIGLLGKGAFSKVLLVKNVKLNLQFALKAIDNNFIRKFGMEKDIENEIKIHSSLNHPNIITYIGSFSDVKRTYIILEYAQNSSLRDLIRQKLRLSPSLIKKLLFQLIGALIYLKNKLIIHRDIKPENILLDEKFNIKLADFGCSCEFKCNENLSSNHEAGTREYMAPEIINGNYPCFGSDAWSLGCTIYEMLEGKTPFHNLKEEEIIKNILNCNYNFTCNFDNALKDLISKILIINPEQRISLKEIIQHSFLDGNKNESNNLGNKNTKREKSKNFINFINANQGINFQLEEEHSYWKSLTIFENYFTDKNEDWLNKVSDKKEDIIISSQLLVKLNNEHKFFKKAILITSSPSIKIFDGPNFTKLKKIINIHLKPEIVISRDQLIVILTSQKDKLAIKYKKLDEMKNWYNVLKICKQFIECN